MICERSNIDCPDSCEHKEPHAKCNDNGAYCLEEYCTIAEEVLTCVTVVSVLLDIDLLFAEIEL